MMYIEHHLNHMNFVYTKYFMSFQGPVHDHSYLQRPFTEFWVDEALKVKKIYVAEIKKK